MFLILLIIYPVIYSAFGYGFACNRRTDWWPLRWMDFLFGPLLWQVRTEIALVIAANLTVVVRHILSQSAKATDGKQRTSGVRITEYNVTLDIITHFPATPRPALVGRWVVLLKIVTQQQGLLRYRPWARGRRWWLLVRRGGHPLALLCWSRFGQWQLRCWTG